MLLLSELNNSDTEMDYVMAKTRRGVNYGKIKSRVADRPRGLYFSIIPRLLSLFYLF